MVRNTVSGRCSFMDLISLWEIHCEAGWPTGLGSHEGELMTLDTVISRCVRHYCQSLKE